MACGVLYIIGKLLELKCLKWSCIAHFNIWNTSYGQKKVRVKLSIWLLTKKNQESTWFTWLQRECDISLKSFWQELQFFFRPHLNSRFTQKVMGLQSHRNSSRHKFETLTRESGERKAIWMWAPWPATKYTIKGKVVASPKSGPWWV